MSISTRFFLACLIGIGLSFPLCIGWILAKLGIYKRWYVLLPRPGIIFRRHIYTWPLCFGFLIMPFLVFVEDESIGYSLWGWASILGIVFAIYMVFFPPRWAQPYWVLDLEDRYDKDEIYHSFRPAWSHYASQGRKSRKHWSRMMDTSHGVDKMVEYARNWQKLE